MGFYGKFCVSDVLPPDHHHTAKEDRPCEDHYGELAVEEVAKVFETAGDGQAEDGEAGDEGVGVEGEASIKDIED